MEIKDDILTVEELMKYLKIGRTNLYKLRKKGLPSFKVGGLIRFKREEVMKWLEENQDK